MPILLVRARVVSARPEHFEGGFKEFGTREFQPNRRFVNSLTLDAERAQIHTYTCLSLRRARVASARAPLNISRAVLKSSGHDNFSRIDDL